MTPVAVSKRLRAALIDAGLAEPFAWSPAFVVRSIRCAGDIAPAKFLFRLAYDRLSGVAESALLERIATQSSAALRSSSSP